MADTSDARHPVEALAEEFLERRRRGERPAVSEYTRRYPDLADQIRGLFPALQVLEEVRSNDDAPIQTPATANIGTPQRLGDFRIIREVGHGGMGVVYEAEQVSLGRRVALKVLPKQALLDSKHAKRFEREARAAAKLHHTNIVPVFGVGSQDGLHYYVMQFIHGLGLDEVLVELKRLRDEGQGARVEGRAPRVEAERGGLRIEDGGWRGVRGDVSAVCVAQSLVSGRFERTVLVESDSDTSDQPSAVSFQNSEVVSLAPSSNLHPPSPGAPPPSDTAVGRLSDTQHASGAYALPGQSEHTSRAHSRSVYWQSVARIGVQAAEALQYAHDQGVIHRDVKPGNLLLDTRGCVWVTDFGLAKATDQQDLTHTGDVLGTLRYMAPEQFDGKADARSDVYSLGLTLYELLAVQPAFDEKERHRLVKQVTAGTPARLRTIDRSLPRDLETIVHKAIERDPAHRYRTANELAADLRRYLAFEPIRARWSSPLTRWLRWCRRNPVIASLASAIVLLLTTAAVAATVAALRFEDLARQKAVRQQQAEHQLQQALDSVDRMLTRVADERLENVPFMEEVRRGLYEDALDVYRQILARSDDDPAVRLELAVAERRVAGILEKLGRHDEAREAAESAAGKLFDLCKETPPVPRADLELARLLIFQASVVNADAATAIGQMEQAVNLLRPHDAAADRDASRELAHCLNRLARWHLQEGHRNDAANSFEAAEQTYVKLLAGRVPDRDIAIAYVKHLMNYGNLPRNSGEWERAEAIYRKGLEVTAALLEQNASDAEARLVRSVALHNVAAMLMFQGQAQAASDRFRDAVEIQQRLVGEFPLFPEYRLRLADTLMSASGACTELNEHENAVKALKAAIEALEHLTENWPDVRKYHGTLGGTLSNLAYVLAKPGASPDTLDYAETLASRAIEEQRLALERPDEPNVFLLKHYFVLVMVQGRRGRVREALATCEAALRIGEVLESKYPENPEIQWVIAEVRRLKGVGEDELKKLSAPPQEQGADEK